MKNLLLLTLATAFLFSFNSCKKCNECVKTCSICSIAGAASYTPCRTDYSSDAEYFAAVQNYELSGYNCVDANETDDVCTSGLFFKLRHQEAIDSKEAEGFDCN